MTGMLLNSFLFLVYIVTTFIFKHATFSCSPETMIQNIMLSCLKFGASLFVFNVVLGGAYIVF